MDEIFRRVELKRDAMLWDRAMAIMDEVMDEARMDGQERFMMRIAVDEAIANVADHTQTETLIFRLRARMTADDQPGDKSSDTATLEANLIYDSPPFDTAPRPETDPPSVRGYGLALMRVWGSAAFRFSRGRVWVTLSIEYTPG